MTDPTMDCEKWFDDALAESSPTIRALTDAGRVRRAAMRRSLQGAVMTRRRRRTAARSAGAVLAVLALGIAWWQATPVTRLPEPGSSRDDLAALQHVDYRAVTTDRSMLERYRVDPPAVSAVLEVGDDELLRLLAAAGRPTGLIRMRDRVIVTRDVVDPIVRP